MNKKRILSFIFALVIAISLLPGVTSVSFAADDGARAVITADDIVIIYTNDIHCGVNQVKDGDGNITNIGYAGVAAYVKEAEQIAGKDNVTLVDAGDAVQGDAIGTLSKGSYIVDIMNKVGYDIFVPGNHEFDYGMARMLELMSNIKGEVISSNFTDTTENALVYKAYEIIEYGDIKIAYVGITTPESFTKSTPVYFQNDAGEYIYGFREGNNGSDLYNATQKAVDAAIAEGADYVIAVGHLGIEPQSSPWRSTDVIANTTGIDAFIDGHSHSTIESDDVKNKDGGSVVLTQTGTKLANIGCMTISKDGKITAKLVSGYDKLDAETDAFVKDIEKEFEADLAAVIGKTSVDLVVSDPATGNRIVRSRETNLGDLCADAYRFVLGNGKTGDESGPADIAFINGGGIRADIKKGDITFGELIAVHPFNNAGCVVEATGRQILDALEMSYRLTPYESGGFLHVSGITFTIDTTIPSSVITDDKGNFISADGTRRVKDVKVGGEPIDADKIYTLASHNYMLIDGGDGLDMFRGNEIAVQPVILDNQLLISYIEDYLDGTVDSQYSNPYGQERIHIISAVTRGELINLLWTYAGKPSPVTDCEYADVEQDNPYTAAIAWGTESGIVRGVGNNLFEPDTLVTREQTAVMLYALATRSGLGELGSDSRVLLKDYADGVKVSEWAADAMQWALSNGIFEVFAAESKQLNPETAVNTDEIGEILITFAEYINYNAADIENIEDIGIEDIGAAA